MRNIFIYPKFCLAAAVYLTGAFIFAAIAYEVIFSMGAILCGAVIYLDRHSVIASVCAHMGLFHQFTNDGTTNDILGRCDELGLKSVYLVDHSQLRKNGLSVRLTNGIVVTSKDDLAIVRMVQ